MPNIFRNTLPVTLPFRRWVFCQNSCRVACRLFFYVALCASKARHRFGSERVSWCLETSLFLRLPSRDGTPFPGRNSVPPSFVSFFVFYIFSYLLSKTVGFFSGCLMSFASIQKLFCGIYPPSHVLVPYTPERHTAGRNRRTFSRQVWWGRKLPQLIPVKGFPAAQLILLSGQPLGCMKTPR